MMTNRRRRKKRRNRGKVKWEVIQTPEQGDPTDYLDQASVWLRDQPIMAVILYYRVSTDKQNRNRTYAWQERCLRHFCDRNGIAILDEFYEHRNGHGTTSETRPAFAQAVELATAHNVPILAASTDRYLRPLDFDKFDQSAQPIAEDFKALMTLAGTVPLLTLLAPDTDWTDAKSLQRIESAKASKGEANAQPLTRPERKDEMFDEVVELDRWNLSSREIKDELVARGRPPVSHKTIWKWLNEVG